MAFIKRAPGGAVEREAAETNAVHRRVWHTINDIWLACKPGLKIDAARNPVNNSLVDLGFRLPRAKTCSSETREIDFSIKRRQSDMLLN